MFDVTTANDLLGKFDELEAEAAEDYSATAGHRPGPLAECPACTPQHTVLGGKPAREFGAYGTTHDIDCKACLKDDADRQDRIGKNPHRPGTKAAARWDSEQSRVMWATSPRSETYWAS